MAMADGGNGRFDIGRVASRTFELVGRNLVAFSALSLLLLGVPYLLLVTVLPLAIIGSFGGSGTSPMVAFGIIVVIVYLLAALLLQASLTRAAIDDLSGKRVSIAAALRSGASVLLPLVGLMLVFLAIGLLAVIVFSFIAGASALSGSAVLPVIFSVAFVVAGLYLFVRWLVTTPVIVVERLGVFAALRRSTSLSENHRWAILGLLLLYVVFVMVLQFLAALVIPQVNAIESEVPIVPLIVLVLLQIFTTLILTTGIASAYFELRQSKDGIGVTEIAQVFA